MTDMTMPRPVGFCKWRHEAAYLLTVPIRGSGVADCYGGFMRLSSIFIAGVIGLSACAFADQTGAVTKTKGSDSDFSHKWLVRVRALDLVPQNGSGAFNFGGTAIGADAVHLSTKVFPEVDFSYFFTRNIAAELVLTYPQQHDVTLAGVGNIGTLTHLPPTLLAQYHFPIVNQPWEPYLGLGINFTWITSSNLNAAGTPLDVTTTSYGLAYQGGIDYNLNKCWLINLDFKHLYIHTNVKAGGSIVTNVDVNPNLFSVGVGYRF